jgi:hypothetical protein
MYLIAQGRLPVDDREMNANRMARATVILVLATAGCSTSNDRVAPTPSQSPTGPQCVEATNLNAAISGSISAGPFDASQGQWSQPDGTKVWVSSAVDGPNNGATIRAHRADGTATDVVDRRSPEQSALDEDGELFYPGTLRLPTEGSWRIEISIGADSGCFLLTI